MKTVPSSRERIHERGRTTPFVVGIILVILFVAGVWYFGNQARVLETPGGEKQPALKHMPEEQQAVRGSGEERSIGGGETMIKKTEGDRGGNAEQGEATPLTFSGTVLAGRTAPLLDFVKMDYEKALASDKLIVLYFYANWCPICRVEIPQALFPAFNELTDERVVGFRVNYRDNETDQSEEALAREFGVGYQHTKVLVKNRERVLKAPDSWDKARYLREINQALAR